MNIEYKSARKRALVVGGSMSGLLAARVLGDFYENVIVLERDNFANDKEHRRGVPQSRHAHGLLAGGLEVLEKLFPNFADEMMAFGALSSDPLNDGRWFFEGNNLRRSPSGTTAMLTSRPLLENIVRNRVRSMSKVKISDKHTVRELVASESRRITGVRTDQGTIDADLVVDASGRGSRSPQWLDRWVFHGRVRKR